MKKRIIFCDVDGTIVDGSRDLYDITPKTREAIRRLKKDSYFIVASGRAKCMLPKGLLEMEPDGYILNNGAYVEANGKVLKNHEFTTKDLKDLIDYAHLSDNRHVFISQKEIYFENKDDELCNALMHRLDIDYRYLNFELKDKYNFAVMICSDESKCEDFIKTYDKRFKLNRQYIFRAYDVNFLNDSKGDAIKLIKDALGELKTYCFGDSSNDIEMMEVSDVAIALGNAKDEVKAVANYVTDDVINDGLYKACEALIFNQASNCD